jgi:chemotaxis protein CheC
MSDLRHLSEAQIDALREVGNIGAGHAATALSQLLQKKIMISVPEVIILPMDQVAGLVGEPETLVAGVFMHVLGDATARILLLLPRASAIHLSDLLLKKPEGSTKVLNELAHSAIKETGNILASAYLNALSEFLGLLLIPSVPNLAFDIAAAVLATVSEGYTGNDLLCITTEFIEEEKVLKGYFLLIPDQASLPVVLQAIRVE